MKRGGCSPGDERFEFENLSVYGKALDYVDFVYGLAKAFPKSECYGLADQLKRAASSVALNIAEGSGGSKAEFVRFLMVSRRSVRECVAITEILARREFIDGALRAESRRFCVELSKMLNGLIRAVKGKTGSDT